MSNQDSSEGMLLSDDVALVASNLDHILKSSSYKLAHTDNELLESDALHSLRLMLEFKKPDLILDEHHINSTIVVFGGTQVVEHCEAERRLKDAQEKLEENPLEPSCQRNLQRQQRLQKLSFFYNEARLFAQLATRASQSEGQKDCVVVTGAGPGLMEAANRGAFDVGGQSIGLGVTLPFEETPNPFITPELCFQFDSIALRKLHFLKRAAAVVLFPGGFGSLDELFEVLTLRLTQKMSPLPIILVGKDFWSNVINFEFLADSGLIPDAALDLFSYAESAKEAWEIICRFNPDDSCP